MEPEQFFTASRVVIVAGKGGVGKTTVTAAMSRAASIAGLSSLVVEVEGKSGLASMFDRAPLTYTEATLVSADPGSGTGSDSGSGSGEIRARTLTPDDALVEYLTDHGLKRLSKRLMASGVLDVVATAAPGIKDILILGKVKQLERAQSADLLILDAPAAGHAITFLLAARSLLDTVRVGPIRTQAAEVLEMLTDASRCQVVLVTLPEETPVNELVETAFHLEDRVGMSLGPVVVNGLYPERRGLEVDPAVAAEAAGTTLRAGEAEALVAAADFRRHRMALQAEQLTRLAERLPLPQVHLPYLFDGDLGPTQVTALARVLTAEIEALVAPAGSAAS